MESRADMCKCAHQSAGVWRMSLKLNYAVIPTNRAERFWRTCMIFTVECEIHHIYMYGIYVYNIYRALKCKYMH